MLQRVMANYGHGAGNVGFFVSEARNKAGNIGQRVSAKIWCPRTLAQPNVAWLGSALSKKSCFRSWERCGKIGAGSSWQWRRGNTSTESLC
jgi:hypothetical protein